MYYLLGVQNPDGGWGGDRNIPSSTEETALALIALSPWREHYEVWEALTRGVAYLVARVEDHTWQRPAPIGLYFSSLWYTEELYPIIWTVEALACAIE